MELCKFSNDLCAKVMCVIDLDQLQSDIIFILCKFEKLFPSTFFYVMVHLAVHLSYEAKIIGPVTYREKLANLEIIHKKENSSRGFNSRRFYHERILDFLFHVSMLNRNKIQ